MLKRVARVVTRAVAVVILVPPLAPTTSSTSPFGLSNTLGLIEDNGLLPGYCEREKRDCYIILLIVLGSIIQYC